jgi:hypothetical protein
MNYKEFQKMRIPQIEEHDEKIAKERHRWLYHSKIKIHWNWSYGKLFKRHPRDPHIDRMYFLPTFIAAWNKFLNLEASDFGVRMIEHTFTIEVKFLRYWFHIWAWTLHK